MILTTDTVLPVMSYLIIGNVLLPFYVFLWLWGFSNLLNIGKIKKKIILSINAILGILFVIVFFILLNINTDLIGRTLGPFHYEFSPFIELFFIIMIIIVLFTGLLFARRSIKSNIPEIQLKGKFLLIAFILFTLGAILDSSIELTEFTVLLTRMILISSSVAFYLGFVLPDFFKSFLIKEDSNN